MPRFCEQCGSPLEEGHGFCGSCGAKVTVAGTTTTTESQVVGQVGPGSFPPPYPQGSPAPAPPPPSAPMVYPIPPPSQTKALPTLVKGLLVIAFLIGVISGLSVMFGSFGWYENVDEEYDYYWQLTEYVRTKGIINIGSDGWTGTLATLGLLLIVIAILALVILMWSNSSARLLGIIGIVLAIIALLGIMSAGATFDKEMEEEEQSDWDFDVGYYIGFVGSLVLMGLMICVVLMGGQGQPQSPPPPPPPI